MFMFFIFSPGLFDVTEWKVANWKAEADQRSLIPKYWTLNYQLLAVSIDVCLDLSGRPSTFYHASFSHEQKSVNLVICRK